MDISGPGSWPALILSRARWLVNLATWKRVWMSISWSRWTALSPSPKWRSISARRLTLAIPSPPPPPPAPIDERSFISVVSATDQPWLTSPRRWSSGTRTLVEEHLVERRAAGHLAQRPHLHAGCAHVDDEPGEALVLGQVGVGAADDLADVAVVGARRPHLLAGDDPLVAVALGLGLQAGEVGAGARLAEELAGHEVAAVQRGEVLGLDVVLGVVLDRGGDHAEADAEEALAGISYLASRLT